MLNSTSKPRGLRRLSLEGVEERLALSATFEPPALIGLPTVPETEYLPIVIDDSDSQSKVPWDEGGFIDFDYPGVPRNGGLGSTDMPGDGLESDNDLYGDGYYDDEPFYDDGLDGASPTQADGFHPGKPLEISTSGLRLAIIASVDSGSQPSSVLPSPATERTDPASRRERGGWIAIEPILDRMPAGDGDLEPALASPLATRGLLLEKLPADSDADDETALASESARAVVFEMIGGEPAVGQTPSAGNAPVEHAPNAGAPRAADAAQLNSQRQMTTDAAAAQAPAIERGAWLRHVVERLDALAENVWPTLLRPQSASADDSAAWNGLTTATGVVLALGLERALTQQSSRRGVLTSARPLRVKRSPLPRRPDRDRTDATAPR